MLTLAGVLSRSGFGETVSKKDSTAEGTFSEACSFPEPAQEALVHDSG